MNLQSIVAISLLSISLFFSFHLKIKADSVPITIQEFERDLTGDGFEELIQLKAVPLAEKSDFFQDIWVDVTGLNNSWSIPYGGGYKPKLELLQLTHSEKYNLFFTSSSIDNQHSNYQLHIFQNNTINKIDLPNLNFVHGKFDDGFQVSITTSPKGEKKIISIDSEHYKNEGIYKSNGKLVKPFSTKKDIPIFKKHYISKQQGYGLKSFQTLRDSIQGSVLGTIEVLWYFENDKWVILQNNGFGQTKPHH